MHLRTRTPDGVISVFIGESFLNKVGWGQSQIYHHSSLQQVELPATVEMERQWSSLRISKAWVDGHCLQEQPSNTKCLESPGRLTPCMLASRQCGKRWRPFLGSFWTMVIMACAHEAESPFTRQKHSIPKRMREKTLDLHGTEHIQKRSSWSLSRQPRLMCSWSSPKVGVSHVAGFVQQRGYAHKSKWSLGARGNDDQMINL